MKLISALTLAALILPSSVFAASKCPAYVVNPKHAVCELRMIYDGVSMKKKLFVPLSATEYYKEYSGTLEFQYPGVSNPDNKPNSLKIVVEDSTHGNSETCPSTQIIESEFDILSVKATGGRQTSLTIDKGVVGGPSVELSLNCSLL